MDMKLNEKKINYSWTSKAELKQENLVLKRMIQSAKVEQAILEHAIKKIAEIDTKIH